MTYEWDAYDRLKEAKISSTVKAAYKYDAQGRMLHRTKEPASTNLRTVNYWLGLNKIAEERWDTEAGNDDPIDRPDNEATSNPSDAGWDIVGGTGTLVVVFACFLGFPQIRKINSLRDLKPAEPEVPVRGFEVVK